MNMWNHIASFFCFIRRSADLVLCYMTTESSYVCTLLVDGNEPPSSCSIVFIYMSLSLYLFVVHCIYGGRRKSFTDGEME